MTSLFFLNILHIIGLDSQNLVNQPFITHYLLNLSGSFWMQNRKLWKFMMVQVRESTLLDLDKTVWHSVRRWKMSSQWGCNSTFDSYFSYKLQLALQFLTLQMRSPHLFGYSMIKVTFGQKGVDNHVCSIP